MALVTSRQVPAAPPYLMIPGCGNGGAAG